MRHSSFDAKCIYENGDYLANNPTWHAEDSPWKADQILNMLRRNNLHPNSVAEVGCGAGEVLFQLAEDMPETQFTGFELSPDAFQICQQRESDRIHFVQADLNAHASAYEISLCIDVLEHVDDYLGFLRAFRRTAIHKVFHIPLDVYVLSVLRKTMMATRKYVGHLHYFTKHTALATLQDTGYEVLDYCYTNSFDGAPSNSIEARLLRLPRRWLSRVAPETTQTWIGGCSLLVLAR